MVTRELHKFDRFPKEVRLTIVLKLLGYLVQHVRNRHLEMVHPTWIAESLRNEDPQIVLEILNQFSADFRNSVTNYLQPSVAPVANPLKTGSLDCNQVVFDIFCNRFAPMSAPWGEAELGLETLYLLKGEDVMTLVTEIGFREIGRAFALAGKAAVTAAVNRVPEERREDFLEAVRAAMNNPPERNKLAAQRLSALASRPLEESILRLGLKRLAVILRDWTVALRKLAQRIPRDLGLSLLSQDDGSEAGAEGEDVEIMEALQQLINDGRIDKDYVETRFRSADPDARLKMSRQNLLG
jgi:hypothetical protein